jgi:hypothetical protein
VNDDDDDDDDSSSDYGLVRGGAIIMKRGFRLTKQGRSRSGVVRGQHGDSGEDRGYEEDSDDDTTEESDSDDETRDIGDGGGFCGCGTWKRSNSKRRSTMRWSTGGVKRRRMGRRSCCVSGAKLPMIWPRATAEQARKGASRRT